MKKIPHSIRTVSPLIAISLWFACGGSALSEPVDPAMQNAVSSAMAPIQMQTPAAALPTHVNSLFYTPEQMAKLRGAMNAYTQFVKNGNSDGDFLSQLVGNKANKEKYYVYPQFYLESLVYHSPTDWTAWINHQQFTKDKLSAIPSLHVVAIEKEKITIEWTPQSMEKVTEVWETASDPHINVAPEKGVVTFELHPNQTFTSYAMRIVEGKLKPAMVAISAMVDQPKPLPPKPVIVPAPPKAGAAGGGKVILPEEEDDGKDPSRRGLRGLLGAYSTLNKDKKP